MSLSSRLLTRDRLPHSRRMCEKNCSPRFHAFNRRGLLSATGVLAQNHFTDSPKQPYANAPCHLKSTAVAGTDFPDASSEFFPARQWPGDFQQFAGLTKIGLRSGRGLEAGLQSLAAW